LWQTVFLGLRAACVYLFCPCDGLQMLNPAILKAKGEVCVKMTLPLSL